MPSTPERAFRALTDAGDVRRAVSMRRVMHDRDDELAGRRSALYEELRLLTDQELVERAGVASPRQVLIATIIEKETSLCPPTP